MGGFHVRRQVVLNPFGASVGNDTKTDIRHPVSTWKFGLRVSDDRGDV